MKNQLRWLWQNLDRVAVVVFSASLFFNIRKVFPQNFSYIHGQYSDFLTPTIHLVFLTTLFLIYSLYTKNAGKFKFIYFNVFLIFSLIYLLQLVFLPLNIVLSFYYFAIFALALFFYGTLQGLETKSNALLKDFSKTFLLFATLSSVVALIQFGLGHSLGLKLLGESYLGNFYGVARQTIGNFIFLRGYGFTPHPNILGALLSLGLILNIWLIYEENSKILRYSLIFILLGLLSTFSLSATLASLIGLVSISLLNKRSFNSYKKITLFILIILTGFSLFMFHVKQKEMENPLTKRDFSNHLAVKMLEYRQILGFGLGESMLHMEQYSPNQESWDIQPIHNYLLELGVEGGLGILFLVLGLWFWSMWQSIKSQNLGFSLLASLGILSLFDHYFYTSAQGIFLFWFLLAISPMFRGKHSQNP